MIVTSIRLRNFRLVEDSELEPLAEGVTGLVGPNGSGKSSFLIGLRWALFGVRPQGETNASLIRRGALLDDDFECYADVVVNDSGRELRVRRQMTRKGTVSAKVWVDSKPVSVDSTGAANKSIITFLGTTPEMFDISHVVSQGELNALVDARPAARRVLIEESAGIDILSASVKSASADLSNTPTPPDYDDDVDAAEKAVDAALLDLVAAKSVVEDLPDVSALLDAADSDLKELRAKASAFSTVSAQRATLEDMLADVVVDGDDEVLADVVVPKPSAELAAAKANATADAARRRRLLRELEALPDVGVIDMESVNSRIDSGTEWLAEKTAEHRSILASIAELEKFSRDDISEVCPLCGQEVHDPERTKAERDKKLSELRTDADAAAADIRKGKSLLSSLKAERERAQKVNAAAVRRRDLIADVDAIPVVDIATIDREIEKEAATIASASSAADVVREHNAAVLRRRELEKKIAELPDVEEVSEESVRELTERLDSLRDADRRRERARFEMMSAERVFDAAKDTLADVMRKDKEAKELAAQRMEKMAATSTLRSYREEMLSTLGPTLEEAMSDSISTMTSGEYVSVRLDDAFTAFVTTSSGVELPVSSLSGGETALVSLALRLSLGDMDSSGLLWMDEVGSALDTDRLSTFMSSLHSLGRQVIIVDHRESTSSEYDHVIRFDRFSPDHSGIVEEEK